MHASKVWPWGAQTRNIGYFALIFPLGIRRDNLSRIPINLNATCNHVISQRNFRSENVVVVIFVQNGDRIRIDRWEIVCK